MKSLALISISAVMLVIIGFICLRSPTENNQWITDETSQLLIKSIPGGGSSFHGDVEVQSGCIYVLTLESFTGQSILHGHATQWADANGELEVVFRSMDGKLLCAGRGSIYPRSTGGTSGRGGSSGRGHGLAEADVGIKVIIQLYDAKSATIKDFYVTNKNP